MAKDKDAKEAEMPVADQLLALLTGAKDTDLAVLDEQIAGMERALESRRSLRRILAVQLGVEVPAQKGGRKKATGPVSPSQGGGKDALLIERRLKSARYIIKNGATPTAQLCRLFDIPGGSSSAVFTCDWFTRTADGVAVTPTGREKVAAMPE